MPCKDFWGSKGFNREFWIPSKSRKKEITENSSSFYEMENGK